MENSRQSGQAGLERWRNNQQESDDRRRSPDWGINRLGLCLLPIYKENRE